MNRSLLMLCLGCGMNLCASFAGAQTIVRTWSDPIGDAVIRRTDLGSAAPLIPGAARPDLLSATLSGWNPTGAPGNIFAGSIVTAATAQVFRLDVVFNGLVNPPGPIQFPDHPTLYGNNPVYGFIDFDVDRDVDTGGEQTGGRYNYLEQLARFGAVPAGPLADRAVTWHENQRDFDFNTAPFFERSGADFTLTLCGCTPIDVISEGTTGNHNGIFEAGETWIVSGKFFQRSAGYYCSSAASGGFDQGLYEPIVRLRFAHEPGTNRTTVSLVFPLTMRGAAMLTGELEQPPDFEFLHGSHFSIFEALRDVILSAPGRDECLVLAANWVGRNPSNYLNVLDWNANAIFGTTYAVHPLNASYVWTDAGFNHVVGDMTGDGRADALDRASIQSFIATFDGGDKDCDGIVNGSVSLCSFAENYNVRDINYDGKVDSADLALIPQMCPADWDQRNGLNTSDFFSFLNDFFGGHADFNGDGLTNSADFLSFLSAFFTGCP